MNNYFNNIENFIFKKYINNYPFEIKDKIIYLLQNGKRLRPILCLIFSNIDIDIDIDNNININNININMNMNSNLDIYNLININIVKSQ